MHRGMERECWRGKERAAKTLRHWRIKVDVF